MIMSTIDIEALKRLVLADAQRRRDNAGYGGEMHDGGAAQIEAEVRSARALVGQPHRDDSVAHRMGAGHGPQRSTSMITPRDALAALLATKRRCMAADCQRPAIYRGAWYTCVCEAHRSDGERLVRLVGADAVEQAERALAAGPPRPTVTFSDGNFGELLIRVEGAGPSVVDANYPALDGTEQAMRLMAELMGARVVRR